MKKVLLTGLETTAGEGGPGATPSASPWAKRGTLAAFFTPAAHRNIKEIMISFKVVMIK